MKLPKGVYPGEFNHLGKQTYFRNTGEKRCPKRGEYYLSGAIVQAYKAPKDLSTEYYIARQVELVDCLCCGGSGKSIK